MNEIVVEVRGGVVVEVYGSDPTRITIIDWDEIRGNNASPSARLDYGQCQPLSSLPRDTLCQYLGVELADLGPSEKDREQIYNDADAHLAGDEPRPLYIPVPGG